MISAYLCSMHDIDAKKVIIFWIITKDIDFLFFFFLIFHKVEFHFFMIVQKSVFFQNVYFSKIYCFPTFLFFQNLCFSIIFLIRFVFFHNLRTCRATLNKVGPDHDLDILIWTGVGDCVPAPRSFWNANTSLPAITTTQQWIKYQ